MNMSLVLRSLLAHYPQFREEMPDASNEHGLDLVVSLGEMMSTSVTGSLTPFSYFFSSGFSAHSLAISQALKVRWERTDT